MSRRPTREAQTQPVAEPSPRSKRTAPQDPAATAARGPSGPSAGGPAPATIRAKGRSAEHGPTAGAPPSGSVARSDGIAGPAFEIFPARVEKSQTICILGVARGGTSMAAGLVRRLGVFLGKDLDEANNEDREFLTHDGSRRLFWDDARLRERNRYIDHLRGLIASRNAAHAVWGWKDPLASVYLRAIFDTIRNPVFILVSRDPGAVAQRERIEEGMSDRRRMISYLRVALKTYDDTLQIIDERARPTLLLSYERTLRAPEEAGEAVAKFLGIAPPEGFGRWCQDYIRPDRRDGSIDVLGEAAVRREGSDRSPAVRLLLSEGARLRRDGVSVEVPPGPEETMASANRCFAASTRALAAGQHEVGEHYALLIMTLFADRFPELLDGALGLLAEEMLGGGKPRTYPDAVCGAIYVIGLSHLLRQSAQKAIVYFDLAERMMRRRIASAPGESVLSRGNYVAAVFHLGQSALALGRTDVVEDVVAAFAGGAANRFSGQIASLDNFQQFTTRSSELSAR